MRVVSEEGRMKEEQLFLDFVVHCYLASRSAASTLKQRLLAIKAYHVYLGMDDPLEKLRLCWNAVYAVKRQQGATKRKKAVTPKMLRAIRATLAPDRRPNDAVEWAALVVAFFFFLLRCSEYVEHDVLPQDLRKGVRGCDLVAKKSGNVATSFAEADEVVLTIRGSKTDHNRGEVRNHVRFPGPLCVVAALASLQAHFPQRFGDGAESDLLLFRWSDGAGMKRSDVTARLRQAAVSCGEDPQFALRRRLRPLVGLPGQRTRTEVGPVGVDGLPGLPVGAEARSGGRRRGGGPGGPHTGMRRSHNVGGAARHKQLYKTSWEDICRRTRTVVAENVGKEPATAKLVRSLIAWFRAPLCYSHCFVIIRRTHQSPPVAGVAP